MPERDPFRDPLCLAVVREVSENAERASVAGVIARAGVPASDFYARYATLEDCALDSFERLLTVYRRRVAKAFNSHSSWRDSLRAAAYEAADFLEENPVVTDFGIVKVLKMNSELCRVRREETFIFCGELIDLGRTEPSEIEIDEAAGMFAVGSIVQLLTYRLQTGGPVEPHAIVPEMMYAVVRAYKGEEEAREELSLPRAIVT
jgi:AcrR family transcriptional regulator